MEVADVEEEQLYNQSYKGNAGRMRKEKELGREEIAAISTFLALLQFYSVQQVIFNSAREVVFLACYGREDALKEAGRPSSAETLYGGR